MARAVLLTLPCLLALAACATAGPGGADAAGDPGADAWLQAMAGEHAHHTPARNASWREPQQEVAAEVVVYGEVQGKQARGYLARPRRARGPLPAVLVIHEWWGLNDNIKNVTRQIAGEGYLVLAVDMYGGRVAQTPEEARGYAQEIAQNTAVGAAHLRSAAEYVKTRHRAPRVGVIGWCFGGGWSLQSALFMPENVDAAVMYYGRPVTERDRLEALDAPLLGLFGASDRGIPVDQVRQMESVLKELGKSVEVVVYDGAAHAFANPSGQAYNQQAADDAWRRTTAFFAQHLRGGGAPAQ